MPSKYNPDFWEEMRKADRIARQKTVEMFAEIKKTKKAHKYP